MGHLIFPTARVAGARVTWVQSTNPRGPHPGHPYTPTLPPESHILQGDSADSQLGDAVKAGQFSSVPANLLLLLKLVKTFLAKPFGPALLLELAELRQLSLD